MYFGEVLGKHSEVDGGMGENDITLKTDDQGFIAKFEELMGEGFSVGYNPFDYWEPEEEAEDDEE